MKRPKPLLGICAIAFLWTLVASCQGPSEAYVAADRATFDVIAPDHLVYVNNDPTLTEEQKDRRRRTIATWQARLRAAEEGMK